MLRWIYREIDDAGLPTGRYGVAIAKNLKDMFWNIDEELNPHAIEYLSMKEHFIVSWNMDEQACDDGGEDTVNIQVVSDEPELYVSEHIEGMLDGDAKWKRPKWPEGKELYSW